MNMTQLLRVARHEWRIFIADRTGVVMAVLLGLAVSYAMWNGTRWAHFERNAIQAALATDATTIAAQRRDASAILAGNATAEQFFDPTSPAIAGGLYHGGRYAVLPPAPLAALAIGQSDLRPSYVRVSIQPLQSVLSRDEIENPQTLLVGRFDFAFVAVYLLPLVIIGLSYQLLSMEREEGTLALLLSQPVGVATVVAGKVCARLLLVTAIVVAVIVLVCVTGGIDISAQGSVERLLLVSVVVIAYALVWFALAVLVNVWGWPSTVNAVVLLAVWLAVAVVIPSAVNVVAERLYPAPSRVELIQALRRATDAASTRAAQVLGTYLQDHPDLAPTAANVNMSDFYSRTIAVQADAEDATRPVMDRFNTQTAAQRRLVDRFRVLSPAVLTYDALVDLAGTSDERYRDFVRQIEAYHETWRAFFIARILRQARMTSLDYDQIPAFQYVPESEFGVRGRVWRSLAGVIGPLVMLVIVAAVRATRYRFD
jgi:ABC-2 type transport system permease protein